MPSQCPPWGTDPGADPGGIGSAECARQRGLLAYLLSSALCFLLVLW